MLTWLLALGIFMLVTLGLSLGFLAADKPLKGSCGGLNQLNQPGGCEFCGATRPEDCGKKSD